MSCLFDIACNFSSERFDDDLLEVIERAKLNQVSHLLTICTTLKSFEKIKSKVYEKIFLDLQEDEIELADPIFRKLFSQLISAYQTKADSAINKLIFSNNSDLNSVVTDIIMETEKYLLHSWETKNIFVKSKTKDIGQLVSETILSLRKNLINEKINDLKSELVRDKSINNKDLLEDIMNYNSLKRIVSNKLNRVL